VGVDPLRLTECRLNKYGEGRLEGARVKWFDEVKRDGGGLRR
jgi:hypothetical protein